MKYCIRCKTHIPEDYVVLTLVENYQRAEPYTRATSVKESEATFCPGCATMISNVFWGCE